MTKMTVTSPQKPSFMTANRYVLIAGLVLLSHALAIWALQTGLLMRAVEMIVPVEVLAQIIEPPAPKIAPPPLMPTTAASKLVTHVTAAPRVEQPTPKQTPTSPVLTLNETTAEAPAPAAVAQSPAPVAAAVVASAVAAPVAPAVPAKVILPSSDAEYLSNPKPPYPPMSRRLSEQGSVKVRIYISVAGLPQKAELQTSSGFERLDQAALAAVMQWRYVPGKRGGVPEAMWMGTTISFVLE